MNNPIISKYENAFNQLKALYNFKLIYPEEIINGYWLNDYEDTLCIQVDNDNGSFYLANEEKIKWIGYTGLDFAKSVSLKDYGKEI